MDRKVIEFKRKIKRKKLSMLRGEGV